MPFRGSHCTPHTPLLLLVAGTIGIVAGLSVVTIDQLSANTWMLLPR